VHLVGGDVEPPDGRQGDPGEQAGPAGVEETAQRSSDTVVVDEAAVTLFQPSHHLVVVHHPLAKRVERGALTGDVAQQ
jgi:hypothetical protein